jgi:DNA-binding beta-propeller fold protein YncE
MKKLNITIAIIVLLLSCIGSQTADAAPGDLFASVNGTGGNGGGFIYKYSPTGVQSTFASGLSRPRGLAFDSAGNLFVATNFSNNATLNCTILKIAPDGTQNVFAILGGYTGEGVAIDSSDNVFVMTFNSLLPGPTRSKIYKFTPAGVQMAFGFLPGKGGQGFGLAFDSAGNLFAVDAALQTIYEFTPAGTMSVFVGPSAFPGFGNGPIGLAFNHVGNLFVSTNVFPFTNDTILKFTPSGVESTFATGLDSPFGLVFDSAGNLFIAEWPAFATGDILKFMPDGTSTVFASGIGIPQGNGGPLFLAIQP